MKTKKAIFAEGCFWGVEEAYRAVPGVLDVIVGYTGGHVENPTYEKVCDGSTGHAEAVEVEYDPEKVSYRDLLTKFWQSHDPTTRNRQGPDVGEQYRSAIFYLSEEQKREAEESKKELESSGKFKKPIVTEIIKAGVFYRAEEYHQSYLKKNNLGNVCH